MPDNNKTLKGRQIKCSPGNKPCGGRCIPNRWECREGATKGAATGTAGSIAVSKLRALGNTSKAVNEFGYLANYWTGGKTGRLPPLARAGNTAYELSKAVPEFVPTPRLSPAEQAYLEPEQQEQLKAERRQAAISAVTAVGAGSLLVLGAVTQGFDLANKLSSNPLAKRLVGNVVDRSVGFPDDAMRLALRTGEQSARKRLATATAGAANQLTQSRKGAAAAVTEAIGAQFGEQALRTQQRAALRSASTVKPIQGLQDLERVQQQIQQQQVEAIAAGRMARKRGKAVARNTPKPPKPEVPEVAPGGALVLLSPQKPNRGQEFVSSLTDRDAALLPDSQLLEFSRKARQNRQVAIDNRELANPKAFSGATYDRWLDATLVNQFSMDLSTRTMATKRIFAATYGLDPQAIAGMNKQEVLSLAGKAHSERVAKVANWAKEWAPGATDLKPNDFKQALIRARESASPDEWADLTLDQHANALHGLWTQRNKLRNPVDITNHVEDQWNATLRGVTKIGDYRLEEIRTPNSESRKRAIAAMAASMTGKSYEEQLALAQGVLADPQVGDKQLRHYFRNHVFNEGIKRNQVQSLTQLPAEMLEDMAKRRGVAISSSKATKAVMARDLLAAANPDIPLEFLDPKTGRKRKRTYQEYVNRLKLEGSNANGVIHNANGTEVIFNDEADRADEMICKRGKPCGNTCIPKDFVCESELRAQAKATARQQLFGGPQEPDDGVEQVYLPVTARQAAMAQEAGPQEDEVRSRIQQQILANGNRPAINPFSVGLAAAGLVAGVAGLNWAIRQRGAVGRLIANVKREGVGTFPPPLSSPAGKRFAGAYRIPDIGADGLQDVAEDTFHSTQLDAKAKVLIQRYKSPQQVGAAANIASRDQAASLAGLRRQTVVISSVAGEMGVGPKVVAWTPDSLAFNANGLESFKVPQSATIPERTSFFNQLGRLHGAGIAHNGLQDSQSVITNGSRALIRNYDTATNNSFDIARELTGVIHKEQGVMGRMRDIPEYGTAIATLERDLTSIASRMGVPATALDLALRNDFDRNRRLIERIEQGGDKRAGTALQASIDKFWTSVAMVGGK